MERRKKVLAVTGARSEYDLLVSVYEKLANDNRFDFSIVVTGPHLSDNFGYTARYVENDGFKIEDYIFNLLDTNSKVGRISSIGYQIPALAQTFLRVKPDIILVAGDREEAISVTMTAAFLNIAVAHFFGGDIAKDGNIDNSVRYAASKFAHLHFPSLEAHKENLIRLGEDEWRINVVGNPALDRFVNTPYVSKEELSKRLDFNVVDEAYFVLIQHSIITEVEDQEKHIQETLIAIQKSGVKCFINYPNSDPGNYAIVEAYKDYSAKYPEQFMLFQNLDRITYVNLLRHATCLLGNSSSGLLEAPSLGLPAINIGSRQRGRACGSNVIFVNNEESEISRAIDKVLTDDEFLAGVATKYNPYGDGNASEKIVKILAELEVNDTLIYKNITY
ncbi:UDP-N-acetylglucosamine 2-epimerase [Pontibacter akesuensis]|uniref:GDP/UDP-N,N'-diacetylbacillosamine 2-epimerase (Hydrolysing) n=1 Tax=Pontibacter akesuensis TaxID=388950 RepID=A0A1I7H5V0_9BACT|nr:UDP-N-acetylglucosamine 2-epimerase [Pontibacter akesuensis]GHA53260.1 UDP-N-acetyl glucosamine 2-epimerase [Pontibacter akesuensis]SFU56039.1 GDP/UDP-N,N'-diacetylbacillosamine 2-epimerase (hydrolysing) [Pontibacter akesuensis]